MLKVPPVPGRPERVGGMPRNPGSVGLRTLSSVPRMFGRSARTRRMHFWRDAPSVQAGVLSRSSVPTCTSACRFFAHTSDGLSGKQGRSPNTPGMLLSALSSGSYVCFDPHTSPVIGWSRWWTKGAAERLLGGPRPPTTRSDLLEKRIRSEALAARASKRSHVSLCEMAEHATYGGVNIS